MNVAIFLHYWLVRVSNRRLHCYIDNDRCAYVLYSKLCAPWQDCLRYNVSFGSKSRQMASCSSTDAILSQFYQKLLSEWDHFLLIQKGSSNFEPPRSSLMRFAGQRRTSSTTASTTATDRKSTLIDDDDSIVVAMFESPTSINFSSRLSLTSWCDRWFRCWFTCNDFRVRK